MSGLCDTLSLDEQGVCKGGTSNSHALLMHGCRIQDKPPGLPLQQVSSEKLGWYVMSKRWRIWFKAQTAIAATLASGARVLSATKELIYLAKKDGTNDAFLPTPPCLAQLCIWHHRKRSAP